MKVFTVVGARPQFIKAAVVSRVIAQTPEVSEYLVHTGQHYDNNMSDVFFKDMDITRPDVFLGIGGGKHGHMTGRMLEQLELLLEAQRPDVVLVYGDTNSTLAGALAAVKLQIPLAHVEAGLRSWNMSMPEEINRILTDRISNLLFCPTKAAMKNLAQEAIQDDERLFRKVYEVGDVMFDAVMYYRQRTSASFVADYVKKNSGHFFLATIHRAANADNPERLATIFEALDHLAKKIPVVCPIHPRTAINLKVHGIHVKRVTIWEPVGYFDMLALLGSCACVITDSGGLQKEAYFFQKPCVTLREETEWSELVDCGWNKLAGSDSQKILGCVESLMNGRPVWVENLYGDGHAGEKIIDRLLEITP